MVRGREKNKNTKGQKNGTVVKIKRKYEKSFLKSALILSLYQIKYNILSGAADYFFGKRGQKPTRFLRFINKAVNKTICKCHIMAERCEDYKQKIESINTI